MTTVCVIGGLGTMGSLYIKTLQRSADHVKVLSIDPRSTGRPFEHVAVSDMSPEDLAAVSLWVVASPTSSHLEMTRCVLRHRPDAQILVEKPLCLVDQLADFAALQTQHPYARVYLSDFYSASSVVERLRATALRYFPGEACFEVEIEFTKNRLVDESRGRFVDDHYGVAGYEWWHMQSLLRQVLGPEDFVRYLEAGRTDSILSRQDRSRAWEMTSVVGLPLIAMYTSIDGKVRNPREAISVDAPSDYSAAERALTNDALRHRIIRLQYPSGTALARLEPTGSTSNAALRNFHEIRVDKIGCAPFGERFEDRHMEKFIAGVVDGAVPPLTAIAQEVGARHERIRNVGGQARMVP